MRLEFEQVAYSDLGAEMPHDSQVIAGKMGMPASRYVAGDLSAVARALQDDRSSSYIVVSSNVIEHVYDLNDLWDACTGLAAERNFTAVWCSDANSAKPFISKRRRRTHLCVDHCDRTASDRDSELDSTFSFSSLRQRIIEPLLPEASRHQLDRLTAPTRNQLPDLGWQVHLEPRIYSPGCGHRSSLHAGHEPPSPTHTHEHRTRILLPADTMQPLT